MEIKNVMVVGAGTMGAGIAQLCSQQGIYAVITDISQELADKGKARLQKGLAKRVEKGKITEADMEDVLSRISTAGDFSPAKEADIIIESVVEDLEIKKKVFAELDKLARPGVILATNTTSLSISAMAEVTNRPDKVVQMHFFNPPVIMKLVEIMPGKNTSAETLKAVEEFAVQLGKDPVVCKNEAPAGIVSRCLGQLLNEATWMVASGVADPEDIDKAMKLGANHPMGPLQLIDFIGLDVHRAKMQTLRTVLDDPRYQHPDIIDKMIEEGRLGRKVGKGFYDYE
ncbi:MAG: 3-hydroxybutyryl-CoA dehydrogenase [Candidatus Aminicenantes bacterium]|nr:3-hydroxybutyryl-CoA dehydrogenase [Candidatus Aminicenantes bacterium]NIM81324.1 3-hydroxybutyryl-CoA dehydrogenase [Candidatus Aminicenantes bacterium]NIN20734.1 3-hydroxybutyryl-CoA dehydrogenase [Candidatus Aminicenantes bacterium]NIN44512.1 3-hydroxybutyryl-CoA dehydrogenase [Candidatus Aminicenantes bacterium]NIN87332.1 3-hydroxybutyryl-CoA dehydrogenase [Candidatus Aminicenantes bacterium]